jgi:hypothetical protein
MPCAEVCKSVDFEGTAGYPDYSYQYLKNGPGSSDEL